MIEQKQKEIRNFCIRNADPDIVKKYARYFKNGYDGYGVDTKVFEKQRDLWIKAWENEMTLDKYLELGDELMRVGKLEEQSLAAAFIKSQRENFSPKTFDRIGTWFATGITNWATTDVLCMLVLSNFLIDDVITFEKLKEWNDSDSEWQRRAVPVTLVELLKEGLEPKIALPLIEPLMLDNSQYVQKGIGTLLRGLWKKWPNEVEDFLFKWKDQCGRLIVRYATEKMDKEYRKKFRALKKEKVYYDRSI
jgi:3-methyladenine DNA glycosylase AlkD